MGGFFSIFVQSWFCSFLTSNPKSTFTVLTLTPSSRNLNFGPVRPQLPKFLNFVFPINNPQSLTRKTLTVSSSHLRNLKLHSSQVEVVFSILSLDILPEIPQMALEFGAARRMVSLLVATTADPASIGPASALLALSSTPSWSNGPQIQGNRSYAAGRVRLLQLNDRIVNEDHLEKRWEAVTGERVEEIIFLSRHTAVSNRPALTVHPIGIPHLLPHEVPPAGGRPGWAAPPCPRIGPWLRLLQKVAVSHNLVPEFEVTLEGTHHGPETNVPAMFVEIGSTEDYWGRQDAANVVAEVVREGLGLDGGPGVGEWSSAQAGAKVLVGLGGGHYAPRHMDVVLKGGVWVGHLLSGYSLPMVEPSKEVGAGKNNASVNYSTVGGSWKEAITEAVKTTRAAFPDGELLVHLDSKSLKSWQRNAITSFLAQERIPNENEATEEEVVLEAGLRMKLGSTE
ncbi:hypothetical protein R1flu_007469 [Riccia fluitans]|uniref:D-aminoacyl-tRNA deacylase n=1 Tax=Riccia fluitans TaxID=41844 RepID=A0ABD1YYY3_9MARC